MTTFIKNKFDDFLNQIESATRNRQWELVKKTTADLQLFLKASIWEVVEQGDLESTRLLIDMGADVNEPFGGEYGPALVHKAASLGYADILQLLINQGARLFVRNDSQKTPFDVAATSECQDILRRHGFFSEKLLDCVARGVSRPLKKLISDYGIDVNQPVWGRSPLTAALASEKIEVIHTLLAAGADPAKALPDQNGRTLLHYLVEYEPSAEALELMQCFLSAGLPVNARDIHENTPLHFFCMNNKITHDEAYTLSMIKLLVDAGADINAQQISGDTALHHVCIWKNKTIAQYLLDHDADIDLPNHQGGRAYDSLAANIPQNLAIKAYFDRHRMMKAAESNSLLENNDLSLSGMAL